MDLIAFLSFLMDHSTQPLDRKMVRVPDLPNDEPFRSLGHVFVMFQTLLHMFIYLTSVTVSFVEVYILLKFFFIRHSWDTNKYGVCLSVLR